MFTARRIARGVSTIFATSAVSSICHTNGVIFVKIVIYAYLNCLNRFFIYFDRTSYEKVHKQLEVCAIVTKLTSTCIEILDNEVNTSNDQAQIQSAYKSLVEIYMTCLNIEKNWLPLFQKAFESVIKDQSIRDHSKVYNKYLKILKNLKQYEVLLDSSIHMLEFYPNEYIPLDMICWIYVSKYGQNDLCIEEKLPKSIETYADEVLELSGQHPALNALMAKAIYLYETANYVGARDFLNRGKYLFFFFLIVWHSTYHTNR